MVHILKNIRSKLVEDGAIADGSAPSYFIEGLLYNVPDDKFGNSYSDTFVAAINWMVQADRSKLVCANEQYYLTLDSVAECWPRADCDGSLTRSLSCGTTGSRQEIRTADFRSINSNPHL
jgi:hypothetical protein